MDPREHSWYFGDFFRYLSFPFYLLLIALLFWGFQNGFSPGFDQESSEQIRGSLVMNDSIFSVDSTKLERLYDTVWYYFHYSKHDSIIWAGREMEKIGETLIAYKQDSIVEFLYKEGKSWIGQGMVYQGQFEEGIEIIEKYAEAHKVNHGLTSKLSEKYVGLATAYSLMGDHENALYYILRSLNVIEKALPKGHYYYGNGYSNVAASYFKLGEYSKSIVARQKAIEVYDVSAKYAIPLQYILLSSTFMANGDLEKAFEACHKSIELSHYLGDKANYFLTQSYGFLAKLHLVSGDLNQSLLFLEKAKTHLEKYGQGERSQLLERGKLLRVMSEVKAASGEYEQAIDNISQAIDLFEEYTGKAALSNIPLHLEKGSVYEQMDQPENALRQYQLVLRLFDASLPEGDFLVNSKSEQLPANPKVIDALRAKSIALKKLYVQSPDKVEVDFVFSTFDLTQGLIERLLENYVNRTAKTQLIQKNISFYEAGIDLATTLFNKTRKREYLDRAFAFAEKSKAAILLGALTESQLAQFPGVPDNIVVQEKELRKKAGLYENLYFQESNAEEPDSQMVSYYREKLFKVRKSKDSLKNVLEDHFSDYYRLKYNLDVATTEEIQQNLGKDEKLLEYFLGDSTLFVIALSRNTGNLERISLDTSSFACMSAFQKAVSSPPAGDENPNAAQALMEDGHFLYQLLLESFVQQGDVSRLIIIPDGFLGYIPFNALLTERVDVSSFNGYRNLPYVMRKWCTWEEYSATLMLMDRPTKSKEVPYLGFAPQYEGDELLAARSVDSLLIADLYEPLVRDGLSPLRYNTEEVDEVNREFAGKSFLGPEARESEFKAWAPSSRIVHLAMHALTNDEQPLYSQLVFSKEQDTLEDGNLYAYEIYNLDLNADIVVLSACNTGVGKLQRGEGLMSLSRAFKYAGCPNIVMSLWKADDYATKEVVSRFFRSLRAKAGKAEALQQARLSFLSSTGDNRTHPYYWAGLTLIGDNEPLAGKTRYWVWGVSILVLAFIFVAFRKWA